MRYIDTSIGEAEQTVAWWMQQASLDGLCEFRCQSGYFTLEGSGPLLSALEKWADRGSVVRLLLGSNRAATLASHVSYLAGRLGLPRDHVSLAIVSFDGSLFHPKVYHFVREDGTETAYVGSANFTASGLSGLNVEAGLIVDTRDGDDPGLLQAIRDRIDSWFEPAREGVSRINSPADIERLLEDGYLSLRLVRPPAEADFEEEGEDSVRGPPRPRRVALVTLPTFNAAAEIRPTSGTSASEAERAGAFGADTDAARRFVRHTEASFHYPQGTHLGHILAILWRFETGRRGTPFDDEFIRLSGSLGTGRLAGFRRQIKYKLLAAMEMGLVSDIRFADDLAAFSPELTGEGHALWGLVSPFVDTRQLEMAGAVGQSTSLPQRPPYYNALLRNACAASAELNMRYSETMLRMPAVGQMLSFLGEFPEGPIAKADIYRGFFDFDKVVAFCDEMGIEPQTEESARHRCPFLLNILESLGRIEQATHHITRQ